MADDNEQDLSMEDILSSIKNILAEDELANNPQAAAAAETAVPSVAATVIEPEAASAPEEEILDLSPAMRIAEEEVNLDAELDEVSSTDGAFVLPSDDAASANDEGEPLLQGIPSEMAEPVFDDASDPFYEEPGVSQNPADYLDEEARPVFSAPAAEEELVTIEPENSPAEVIDDIAAAEVIAPQPQAEAESETIPVVEPIYEPEPETLPTPETEMTETVSPAAEDLSAGEAKADNAVDVSASIISNFAKMFTREHDSRPEPETPAAPSQEPVRQLGDGSKTIEDVVAGVIQNIIGAEVAQNWRQGVDYDAFAREEISRQTRQWLDANLPAVVERAVKEEIERVMAKVGR